MEKTELIDTIRGRISDLQKWYLGTICHFEARQDSTVAAALAHMADSWGDDAPDKFDSLTTLQSMVNIYGEYSAGYFDLVISDECHRSIYGKWSGVLKHFDGIQVGLTATPCVADPADSGDEEDKLFIRDTLRFFEVSAPTFSYRMKAAIRDGYLVPYQIYKAKTVKTAADGGFEIQRDDLDWSAMDATTRAEFEKLFGSAKSILIDPAALERKFTIAERNRAIVHEFREVLINGFTDAKGMVRKPLIGKAIVFAVTKRHAETLAQLFDMAFADQKPSPEVRYADYVVSGTGEDDTADGMTKIKRFKKEQFPQILVSVNMLDTGFDCPEVVNLIFARFTKSASSSKASEIGAGLPIIRMGNVTYAGALDLSGLKHVELEPADVDRFRLQKGDILFNRTNSKELVGKTGLWDVELDAVAASYFIRLRTKEELVRPFYLWAFMNSRYMKRVLFDTARGAIGQANINSKELKAFRLPTPPLETQAKFEERC